MLGDIVNDDGSYTGETGDSIFDVQYYRNKVTQFQSVLNALDQGRSSLVATLQTMYDQPDMVDSIQLQLQDFEDKKSQFQAAISAVDTAASTLNAMGVRFPVVSAPSSLATGLGIAPVVIAGVVAVALGLIVAVEQYAVAWLKGNQLLQEQAQAYAAASPEKRDQLAQQVVETTNALAKAQESPITAAANAIKWVVIAVGGFLVYKLVMDHRKGAH